MDCPRCKLTNPESAQRCDCGYDFETKTVEKPYFAPSPEFGMLLMLRRMTVWFIETLCAAVLLAAFLIVWYGPSGIGIMREVFGTVVMIIFVSGRTGYVATTLICRLLWKWQIALWYSAAAAVLCIVHGLYFFISIGTADDPDHIFILMAGACAVFVCTLAGSYVLLRWERPRSDQAVI